MLFRSLHFPAVKLTLNSDHLTMLFGAVIYRTKPKLCFSVRIGPLWWLQMFEFGWGAPFFLLFRIVSDRPKIFERSFKLPHLDVAASFAWPGIQLFLGTLFAA